MRYICCFISGMLFANGIPHFIHGISGEYFIFPKFQSRFTRIPSSLFNTIWGIISFSLALFFIELVKEVHIGCNPITLYFLLGFCFSSLGLSLFFKH